MQTHNLNQILGDRTKLQNTSVLPPALTLTGRQGLWGATTSSIYYDGKSPYDGKSSYDGKPSYDGNHHMVESHHKLSNKKLCNIIIYIYI